MLVSGGRDGSIYVWDTRCSSRGNLSVHMQKNLTHNCEYEILGTSCVARVYAMEDP